MNITKLSSFRYRNEILVPFRPILGQNIMYRNYLVVKIKWPNKLKTIRIRHLNCSIEVKQ